MEIEVRCTTAQMVWLTLGDQNVPVFHIAEEDLQNSKLEVRWKTSPKDLKTGAVEYKVSIAPALTANLWSAKSPTPVRKRKNAFSKGKTGTIYRNATARCGFSEKPVCLRGNNRRGGRRATMLSEADYQEAVRRYKNLRVKERAKGSGLNR